MSIHSDRVWRPMLVYYRCDGRCRSSSFQFAGWPYGLCVVSLSLRYHDPLSRTLLQKQRANQRTVTETAPSPRPKEQQQATGKAAKIDFLQMRVPVLLNFPVVLAELPYILASPSKREWTPRGMLPEEWRALTWPFAGILFWWCAGRGMEALQATRRSVVSPRLTWVETALAIVLLLVGVGTGVGIATSTPYAVSDDLLESFGERAIV